MQRTFLISTGLSALALALAPVASASAPTHAEHHHHRSHHAHSRAHHLSRPHTISVGAPAAATGAIQAPVGSAPAAATVTSFTDGRLTITLADGTMLSGKVTEDTRIECEPADEAPFPGDQDRGDGDRQDGDSGHSPGGPPMGTQGDESRGGPGPGHDQDDNDNDNDNDRGNDNDNDAVSCTAAALLPGAVVSEAELRVGSAGAVWEELELVA
jgi:hypothetical protein